MLLTPPPRSARQRATPLPRPMPPIRPRARAGMGGLLLLALLPAAWAASSAGDDATRAAISALAFAVLSPVSLTLVIWRIRQPQPARDRHGWQFIGGGMLAASLGSLAWAATLMVMEVQPFPSLADVFLVWCPPFLAMGMLLLSGPRFDARERFYALIDSLIVLIAGGLFVWILLTLRPSIRGTSVLVLGLSTYYALGYLVATAVALFAFLRRAQSARSRMLRPLLMGAALFFISQLILSFRAMSDDYAGGIVLDTAMTLALALVGCAALMPGLAERDPEAVEPRARVGASLVPYLAVLPIYALLALLLHRPIDRGRLDLLIAGLVLMTVLLALRQLLTVRDNESFQRQLAQQALHDPLTHLPNRRQLVEQLARALEEAAADEQLGLLYLDLDGFKTVNDTLGHAAGDALLHITSERLLRVVRGNDVVARHGGDEFIVLLTAIAGAQAAEFAAERIRAALRAPITLDGQEVTIDASIGIAISRYQDTPDRLIQEADAAMYRAKQSGKGRWAVAERSG